MSNNFKIFTVSQLHRLVKKIQKFFFVRKFQMFHIFFKFFPLFLQFSQTSIWISQTDLTRYMSNNCVEIFGYITLGLISLDICANFLDCHFMEAEIFNWMNLHKIFTVYNIYWKGSVQWVSLGDALWRICMIHQWTRCSIWCAQSSEEDAHWILISRA